MRRELNSNLSDLRVAIGTLITTHRLPSTTRRIASNTLLLLGVNLSGAVLGFLIAVIIGRGLGVEELGRYSLVMAWTFGLGIFAEFGLNTLITREVARAHDRADEYLTASLIAKTTLSLAFVAALCLAAPGIANDNSSIIALQLGSILIWLNALYGSFTAVFRAFEHMQPILMLNVGGLALQLGGTIWLVASGGDILSVIAVAVVAQAVQTIGALVFVRLFLGLNSLAQINSVLIKQMLHAALPFAFAGIVGAIEARANLVLLGMLQNEKSVGLYSAASRLTEAAKLLPNAFFGAAFPAFAAMGANSDDYFHGARRAIFFFSLFAAFTLSTLAAFILQISFGVAFANAQPTLVILAWSLVPGLVNGLTMLFLYARGKENYANKALGFSLLIQLALAIPLIHFFDVTGAAISALLGDVSLFVFLIQPSRIIERLLRALQSVRAESLAFIVFLGVIFIRLVVIYQTHFDGLYGQDSYAYLDYSASLKSALVQSHVPPPFFWPIGYPLIVAIVSFLIPMAIAAQAVSVVATALTATITYLLTREVLSDRPYANLCAAFAALIFASAGQMMVSSLSAMSDASALCASTLSAYALARHYSSEHRLREKSTRWIAIAAFALGFAIITRWVYGLLIPLLIAAATPLVNGHRSASKRLATATIFLLLGIAPQLALMFYYSSHGITSNAGDLQTVGWNLTNAWQNAITNGDGHFIYSLPIAAFYAQPFAHPSFIFPLLTPVVLFGAWSLRRERFYLILLGGWILVIWTFLIGIAWENPRFSLAFFPPLAILTGVGLQQLMQARPRVVKAISGITLVCIALTFWWGYRGVESFVASQRGDLEVANWMTNQVPANATVISFSITETLKHRTPFRVIEIYNESPKSIGEILSNYNPVFVILDLDNIDAQWKNLSPEINWRALQSKDHLDIIATHPPYTLFAVMR